MENCSEAPKKDDQMDLPPGFRFHPTDEELITHYLSKKVLDVNFTCVAIGEVDMNKIEPWDLPWRAKLGEQEWYFFCVRDKKYPTGLRTNRATAAGYWKATGKDKEIFRGKTLVGMKKTLVFYMGRAPKGVKSNWVTHEYRLEGKLSFDNLPTPLKNDWVISRVFQKTTGGKKVHISGLMRMNPMENDMSQKLPPLIDPYIPRIKPDEAESSRVSCFSTPIAAPHQKLQENMINPLHNPVFTPSPNANNYFNNASWGQYQFQFPGASNQVQDPSFRALLGNHGFRKEQEMVSVSQETAMSNENSTGMSNLEMGKKYEGQDLACMWSY